MQRIADRIRNELSEMLVKEVQDPRLSGISVTDVKIDRELAFADIFVSAVEGQERSKEVLTGLRSAAGFLRHELAARVDLRAFPILRFHWDPTPERADHIEQMLASLRDSGSMGSDSAEAAANEQAAADLHTAVDDEEGDDE
jgi:ribosome-binding factor A